MKVYATQRTRDFEKKSPKLFIGIEYDANLLFDIMASKTPMSQLGYILWDRMQAKDDIDLEVELRYIVSNWYFKSNDRRD